MPFSSLLSLFLWCKIVKNDIFYKTEIFYLFSSHLFISDIDECAQAADNNCDLTNGACANTAGSFTCTCNDGYTGDGTSCTGIQLFLLIDVFSSF